jgi:hypothetical protein
MSTAIVNTRINRKWFLERLRYRYMTQRDLALALGVNRASVHRALTGRRLFSGQELGTISIVLQQPLTEVAKQAGVEFWAQPDKPKTQKARQREAFEAVEALARALGISL